jgi:hypothetical protein
VPWIKTKPRFSEEAGFFGANRGGNMKRVARPIATSMVLIFVITTLILFMIGCTTSAKRKEVYWNSQIGVAKYNDVVTRLGPPATKETLSDKSLVAKWVRTSYSTARSEVGSDSWTEEIVMRFSPDGILTHSTLNEY